MKWSVRNMSYYRDTITLSVDEHVALMHFNNEIYLAGAGCSESIDHARIRAIRQLPGKMLSNLASAFSTLWPHWFTNGRLEMAPEKICLDVIKKISAGCRVGVPSGLEWLGRMGGMRLTGNKRRIAIPDEGYGVGRGIRGAKMCEFHPDKKSIGMAMCSRCYGRNRRLVTMGYDTEEFSEKLFNALMKIEALKKSFTKEAMKLIEKHDRKVLHE